MLGFLAKNNKIENTEQFSQKSNIPKDNLDPVLKSLLAEDYIVLEVIERKVIELTEEGNDYATNGSPEFQFVSAMKMGESVNLATMGERIGDKKAKIGFGKAMKQKWIKKNGNDFERIVEKIVDED